MKLNKLLMGIDYRMLCGSERTSVTGINIDSRLVKPGDLFVATVGRNADGHKYAADAIARGAAVVLVSSDEDWADTESWMMWCRNVSEADPESGSSSQTTTAACVPDTRLCLSEIVNRFYHDPSSKFNLIGVTGTNGKTSTCALTDHILRNTGRKTGLIGTIANYCGNEILEVRRTTPTTPDCVELGEIMDAMVRRRVDDMVMEMSSMGLKAGRVNACHIGVGVFTNLSPEHLDDHGTMEDYRDSKAILFGMAENAVINADDPYASFFAGKSIDDDPILFGIRSEDAGLKAGDIRFSQGKVSFSVTYEGKAHTIIMNTPSEFAIYNSLAAIGAALRSGVTFDEACVALEKRIDIPGRYEVLVSEDEVSTIIDYAHTAAALENLLNAVRGNPAYGRIISVFGCGGDRDPSKRAAMGEISGRLADFTFITTDNPRTEDPDVIINSIEEGIIKSGANKGRNYAVVPDRGEAIKQAISSADPGDAVVISGKGHEDYQIIGTEKIHFDDREQVREVFGSRRD